MTFLRAGDKVAAMHIYLCRGFRSQGIQYCMVRGSGHGPLFCFPDASPVASMSDIISLTVFASHAAEMGFTDAQN